MLALLTPSVNEFVSRLRSRGVTLRVEGSKLLASPRTLLTDSDRLSIREHKAELLAWLAVADDPPGVAFASVRSKPEPQSGADWLARYHRVPVAWDTEESALIDWFQSHRDGLPREPFKLFAHAFVFNPTAFYLALEQDIRAGPNGPRAAGLRNELRRLREKF